MRAQQPLLPPDSHPASPVIPITADFSVAPVVLTGEPLLPAQALALQHDMAAKGQRWAPRPDASLLFPPRAFSHAVVLPLPSSRQSLGQVLGGLALIFTVLGLAGFFAAQMQWPFMQHIPHGAWQQALGLGVVMGCGWWLNRRPTASRRRTIMSYPAHELADVTGFVPGMSLSVQVMDEGDVIDQKSVLPRTDGVLFGKSNGNSDRQADPQQDLELHFMCDLFFTPKQPAASAPPFNAAQFAGAEPQTVTGSGLVPSQAALVYFASQIEQALGWPAGRVWVLDVPLPVSNAAADPGIVWATLWLQGGRTVPIDWVCEALTSASIGVLRRYDPHLENPHAKSTH